jgi:sulfatase modifying factor 1
MKFKFLIFIFLLAVEVVSFAQFSGGLPPLKKTEPPNQATIPQKSKPQQPVPQIPTTKPPLDAKSSAVNEAQREEDFWNDTKSVGNTESFEAYLKAYPNGRYRRLAESGIEKLNAEVIEKQKIAVENARKQAALEAARQAALEAARQAASKPSPGQVFKDCSDCPDMVVIPAGRYFMGALPGEEEDEKIPQILRNRSQPRHIVSVASFSAGRYEVTVGQYSAFVIATNRKSASGCTVWNGQKFEIDLSKNWRNTGFLQSDSHPVSCVSWEDSRDYVQWLKQKTGKDYRLLTEAEWEYAARAGTITTRHWGDDANLFCSYGNSADAKSKSIQGASDWTVANCDDGYSYTAPVGSFRANSYGLYDMLGNVSEWVQDCWFENYVGAPLNGVARISGVCSLRVLRGGSWSNLPALSRSATRGKNPIGGRYSFNGFRVALASN